jgi:hypothetical protein
VTRPTPDISLSCRGTYAWNVACPALRLSEAVNFNREKVNRKRARTKDLGAKKAGTVKGGIAWGRPTLVAATVNQKLVDGTLTNLKY